MSKYLLKGRLAKIVEMIDQVTIDLKDVDAKDIGPYSLLARASCFSVEQICEHLISMEDDLVSLTNQIPFKEIHGIRVRIAHMYDSIEMDIIYQTIMNDFPNLRSALLDLIRTNKRDQLDSFLTGLFFIFYSCVLLAHQRLVS